MGSGFTRYQLRTTDLDAAKAFYLDVLGLDLGAPTLADEPSPLGIVGLPQQARARGAPSHWLGSIGVSEFDAKLARLLALGGEALGPSFHGADGARFAVFRDPTGAVMALRDEAAVPRRVPVSWHHLHSRDLDRSVAAYEELFGWTTVIEPPMADFVGEVRAFSWDAAATRVGTIANTARAPGTHPHWTFFFEVAALGRALDKVRALGGIVVRPPTLLPNGRRIVPCDDPQGAAFGLITPPV